jgi:hypothetical protein
MLKCMRRGFDVGEYESFGDLVLDVSMAIGDTLIAWIISSGGAFLLM